MNSRRLRRKFLSLAVGELTAVMVFAYVYRQYWHTNGPLSLGTTYAFLVLEFLLLQGSAYWASWLVESRRAERTAIVFGYRILRVLNLLLLTLLPFVLLLKNFSSGLAIVLAIFALVEYINYFVVRLAFPLTEFLNRLIRWRFPRSLLASELKG